ncbi:MAG: hypothetical protein ACRD0G_00465 [Acidimicrobiales bacterium]
MDVSRVVARRRGGVLSAPTHGLRLWFAVSGGVWLWLVHLTALSALVNLACRHPAVEWALHGATALLGAATVLAGWWCVAILRLAGTGDDEEPDLHGRLRFIALFGLITEVTSLLLILAEGAYVPWIDPCA